MNAPESTHQAVDAPPSQADDEADHCGDGQASSLRTARQLEVGVIWEVEDTEPPAEGWLQPMLSKAAYIASAPPGVINLMIVDDATMAQYHEQYCGVPGTTDVVTFDHRDPEAIPDGDLEGDLVLCSDEARRQATARGHSVRQELLLYAVHGLLHLLGEDDHEAEDYAQMHAREDQILTAIGQGPLFYKAPRTEKT